MDLVIDDLVVPALWLRDACPCAECRDPRSGQRLRGVLTLPADTTIAGSGDVAVDGDSVRVRFAPDGHEALFSISWLRQHAPGRGGVFDDRSERARRLWSAVDLPDGLPTVAWPELQCVGAARHSALRQLLDRGVLVVRGVPAESGQVLAVARSFGFVRVTNYGELFDVRVEPQPNNLAYTPRAIAPHTDNPYREPVPGMQLLHCLQSSASGGENVLLDGFRAAAILRENDPAAFATLTTTPLSFRFDDEHTALRASAPVIALDHAGSICAIRWNDRSVEPPQVAPAMVPEVYRALRAFAAVANDPALHVLRKLEPGDCLIMDNTRVMHARTAFADGVGARHLQGCYADLDGLASTVAVVERRGEAAYQAVQAAFASAAGLAYLGEEVTMLQHQLQAAAHARAAGCDDALVVASLLHDVGHLVGTVHSDTDQHHEASGSQWLTQWFGPEVTEPVRLHVAAKRYLVATEPDYAAQLSPASVHTLTLQGGPMTAAEADDFGASPHAAAAIALRRFDELAKEAAVTAPGIEVHRDAIVRCVR